jgi:hypothetical protein
LGLFFWDDVGHFYFAAESDLAEVGGSFGGGGLGRFFVGGDRRCGVWRD